jgi:type IV pilus assembly protein PilN
MRIPINLATEPMRRDRPIIVASAAVGVLLCLTLAALIGLIMTDRSAMADSRRAIDQVQRQLTRTNATQAQLDAKMRQPENSSVLYRSQLFNTLIKRKAVSWTRIFSDLQTVVPYDVRIVSIRPQLNGRGELSLEMVVASQTPEPVIGFISKLELSNLFGDVTQTSQTPPTQTDPLFRFHLTVMYDQKL